MEFKFEGVCLAYSSPETRMGSIRFRIMLLLAVVALGCSLVTVKPLCGLNNVQRLRIPRLDQLPKPLAKTPTSLLLAESGETTSVAPTISRFHVSELVKINSLMLFFYSTLGAVMPYMPLYYRKIGISGKAAVFHLNLNLMCFIVMACCFYLPRRFANWDLGGHHPSGNVHSVSSVGCAG